MTQQPHTTSLTARISFNLFVLVVVVYEIGSISREFSVLAVGKNALINRFNVFYNGLNYGALPPDTMDTNDTTGAAHNTRSDFTKADPGFTLNNDITFDLTTLSPASIAALVATIRIENENIFDSGPLWQRATQLLHPTQQPPLVCNNIDDVRREFDVLGYVHDISDTIGFDWDEHNILEYYFDEKFCSVAFVVHLITHLVCVFLFFKNFSMVGCDSVIVFIISLCSFFVCRVGRLGRLDQGGIRQGVDQPWFDG